MKRLFIINKNTGFTLIELMIAIAVSVILLNGVLQLFQSSKQSYRVADNLGRMQENARYALDVLAQDIRQVGFLPCRIKKKAGVPQVANVLNVTTGEYDFFGAPLVGFEGGVSTFPAEFQLEGTIAGTRLAGSDALRILKGGNDVYSVESHNPTSAQFKLNRAHTIDPGDILLVCDAENASILQVTNANQANVTIVHNTGTGSPGNCTKGLGYPVSCTTNGTAYTYGPGSQVVNFESSIYYIGPSLATDTLDLKTNSLYRRDQINSGGNVQYGDPQELVQGIETMQILYGVAADPNSAAVRYVPADAVGATEWANVVSVRIGLLFHTPEEVSPNDDTTTYNVAGTSISPTTQIAYPSDRRQRYVFTATIKIRNRGSDVAS